jgi:hypothetical protein
MVTIAQAGFAYYDGAAWTSIPDETSSDYEINAIWGVSSEAIIGVDSQAKIIRFLAPTSPSIFLFASHYRRDTHSTRINLMVQMNPQ